MTIGLDRTVWVWPLMITSISGTARARFSSSEFFFTFDVPVWERQTMRSTFSLFLRSSTIFLLVLTGSLKVTGLAKGVSTWASFPRMPNRPILIAPALDDRIGDDRVLPEGLLQIAVSLAVRAEDHVGGDHDGEFLFRGAGLAKRLRQAVRMEVEIVIPEGHHVVTHRRHEAEFRRLRHEGGVEEGPHAEVAGIDKERPVALAVLPDERQKLRISASLHRRAVRGGDAPGEKIGVQIMGEQNNEPFAGRRLSGGDIHPGKAGSNHEQGDDRRDHSPQKERVSHVIPPSFFISFMTPRSSDR